MQITFWTASAILIAALVNTVPSKAAFHPVAAKCGLKEADLCGSGLELRRDRTARNHSRGNRHDADAAREWQAMAARCRNLAEWQNDGAREILLKLADEYEARAKRAAKSEEA